MENLTQHEQRSGTRRLMIGGVILGGILFAAVTAWPLMRGSETGTPAGYSGPREPGAGSATGTFSNQGDGESAAGKQTDDITGSRRADIRKTAGPSTVSSDQRGRLHDIFGGKDVNRADRVDFTIAIGSVVPQQANLKALPPEASNVLGGYAGSKYVLVRDQLVIVDQHTSSITAIIPGVG